jgi:hypothetical protein
MLLLAALESVDSFRGQDRHLNSQIDYFTRVSW